MLCFVAGFESLFFTGVNWPEPLSRPTFLDPPLLLLPALDFLAKLPSLTKRAAEILTTPTALSVTLEVTG